MEKAARRFLVAVLAGAFVAHASHFGRYFIRDELVGLHRATEWSVGEILGRSRHLVSGELGDRPHVIAYLYFKALWATFGAFYPGYAGVAIALHLAVTTLVLLLGVRLAPAAPNLGPLAALAFGVWGGGAELGNFTIVQHVLLAGLATALGLAYLAYREEPSSKRGAFALGCALLATLSMESGPVATLVPLLLEACLTLSPASSAPPCSAPRRSLLKLGAACFALSLPRLFHDASALLLRAEALDAAAVERYSVTLSPVHVLRNVAHVVSQIAFAPPAFAGPILGFLAVGLASERVRAVAAFGLSAGLLLALPYCTIEFTAPFYAYSPSPFWALSAAASILAIGEHLPSANDARGRRSRLATLGLVTAVAIATYEIRGRDEIDRRAFTSLRAIRAGLLEALPEGGPPVDLVLHGVPTGRFHPDYPLMLPDALPVLVPHRNLRSVWVIDTRLSEPLEVEFVTYAPLAEAHPPTRARSFKVRGERLVPCTGQDCLD